LWKDERSRMIKVNIRRLRAIFIILGIKNGGFVRVEVGSEE
jgi:hypothetical protein